MDETKTRAIQAYRVDASNAIPTIPNLEMDSDVLAAVESGRISLRKAQRIQKARK